MLRCKSDPSGTVEPKAKREYNNEVLSKILMSVGYNWGYRFCLMGVLAFQTRSRQHTQTHTPCTRSHTLKFIWAFLHILAKHNCTTEVTQTHRDKQLMVTYSPIRHNVTQHPPHPHTTIIYHLTNSHISILTGSVCPETSNHRPGSWSLPYTAVRHK